MQRIALPITAGFAKVDVSVLRMNICSEKSLTSSSCETLCTMLKIYLYSSNTEGLQNYGGGY